jgi:hypothetical protein
VTSRPIASRAPSHATTDAAGAGIAEICTGCRVRVGHGSEIAVTTATTATADATVPASIRALVVAHRNT